MPRCDSMTRGHKIIEFEEVRTFVERIRQYPRDRIVCTHHTFFRLSEKQRELFTCENIRRLLLEEIPIRVGIQQNGNYAVFYKHEKQRLIRIIIDIQPQKVSVVTFYIIEKYQLPK